MGRTVAVALPGTASAGVKTKALRETLEWMAGKSGSRASREAAAPRLERLALPHGANMSTLAKRYGLQMEALERAGIHGDEIVKLFARHGDDALWITAKPGRIALFARYGDDVKDALVKHRALAEELIEKFGAPAGRALGPVSGRQARRLATMSQSGELARIGRTDEVFDVIARFGDRGCDFVWRHKGALATAGVLAAFLADPEPFIDGTHYVAEVMAEHIVQPLIQSGGQVAAEAIHQTNWTLIGVVGLLLSRFRRCADERSN